MAPNTKSSKKGGGKKGGGESKTGAAVRALDDDEEDKIQVTRVSLPSVFMCSQEEHDKARLSATTMMMTFYHLSLFIIFVEHHRVCSMRDDYAADCADFFYSLSLSTTTTTVMIIIITITTNTNIITGVSGTTQARARTQGERERRVHEEEVLRSGFGIYQSHRSGPVRPRVLLEQIRVLRRFGPTLESVRGRKTMRRVEAGLC